VSTCPHYRRRLIAQDDTLEFSECLDCGEILERAITPETQPQKPEPPEGETLSDA